MEIERRPQSPNRQGISMPARVLLGALAIFGAITLVQWVIGAVVATIKFALVVVVVIAVALWVIGAKGSR